MIIILDYESDSVLTSFTENEAPSLKEELKQASSHEIRKVISGRFNLVLSPQLLSQLWLK